MRDNKELRKKLKKLSQETKHEAFEVAVIETAKTALENVQDAINPVSDPELIFLIPALKIVTESLESFVDEEDKDFAENIYILMKMMCDEVKKENV